MSNTVSSETTSNSAETKQFKAEVKQVLDLMINSLYSNKEIFLRELISNASDAAEKLRFAAINNPELYEQDKELKVWVEFNKEERTLTIKDNGIGMSYTDVESNIGTIAKSGTKEFLSSLTGDKSRDSQLIGKFGVGFYSAFIVADSIIVRTRKAGLAVEEGVAWVSKGDGSYQIKNIIKKQRGTEIILHLKKEEDEFLNNWHLRQIITKYSDHIKLPIVMQKEVFEQPEDKDKPKDPNVIEVPEEEVINEANALWTKPKQEITTEEYEKFYERISKDFEKPLKWTHNKVEGNLEYTSLLFIPSRAPFDLFHPSKSRGLKLYVKRVFIMDDAEQFLPNYLRFMKGIVDSNDLPLNVSREILQGNKIIDSIKSALVKRTLGMLEDLSKNDPENYKKFWKEFGQVIKEGPAEDFANKERIAKLLRFSSTNNDQEEQNVSLDDYIARMQDKQDKIYYIAADTFNAAKNSPHLEIFRKKNIEVLLLTDRVDEWLMSHLTEFSGKKLQSVAKGNLELGDLETKEEKKAEEKINEEHKSFIEKVKKCLGEQVKEVRVTKRLTNSPACIVADQHDMTPQMERILKAAGQAVPTSKPILELNPEHEIVKQLQVEENSARFDDWAQILLDQAILAEGGQLENPSEFVSRFNKVFLELATSN